METARQPEPRAAVDARRRDVEAETAVAEKDHKLTEAEVAEIEEENLRRKYMYPQKEATSASLQRLSGSEPEKPTLDEILADVKYPASKADLVLRARNRGSMDDRYAMERLDDRMYMDAEDVKRALRA